MPDVTEDKKPTKAQMDRVVAWVGHKTDRAHVRKISAADFKGVGVNDQVDVTWDTRDPMTNGQARVSLKAAEYLTEVEPGFVLIAEEEAAFGLRK